jgi:5'-3' exonuclease/transcription antitermination factor NusG
VSAEEWVVLELSPRSEGEDPDAIRKAISKHVPLAEVFVPAVVTQIGEDQIVHRLVEGYAFVQRVYPDSLLFKLEGTKYVQTLLATPGDSGHRRKLSIVRTPDVDRMRQQIQQEVHQGIGIGDKVQITSGPYKNIEASVIEEIPETKTVQVLVRLRSKEAIVTIPRSGLLVLDRSPLSPLLSRLTSARSSLRMMWPVLTWRPTVSFESILEVQQEYAAQAHKVAAIRQLSVVEWILGGAFDRRRPLILDLRRQLMYVELAQTRQGEVALLERIAASRDSEPVLTELRARQRRFAKIDGIFQKYRRLWFSILQRPVGLNRWQAIQETFTVFREYDDLWSRWQKAHQEVGMLEAQLGDDTVVQNVLVDGHNLARRCFHAPGMAEIKTSKGVPTGVILGFLRSLGALKKRFPGAQLCIAWDGASRRRKKAFGEYKATRGAIPEGFPGQVEALKTILPTLGVRQVVNADEEADDLVATLVRGGLKDQKTVIFSSDRDFLQLVSNLTSVLVPAAGIRKEILFDELRVKEHYGVTPERILQLRAFVGDDADNIPGVARVPKKVLCSLIQAYGSVDGVYRSGLTGVSKGQYERLRASEPQVRINLALMSLVDVPVSVVDPDVNPDLASSRMQEFEITPDSILEVFFGPKTEMSDA